MMMGVTCFANRLPRASEKPISESRSSFGHVTPAESPYVCTGTPLRIGEGGDCETCFIHVVVKRCALS